MQGDRGVAEPLVAIAEAEGLIDSCQPAAAAPGPGPPRVSGRARRELVPETPPAASNAPDAAQTSAASDGQRSVSAAPSEVPFKALREDVRC